MTKKKAAAAATSPCTACPWRTANHLKRHKYGFYTKANLTRLWHGIRRGDPQSCHPTDPGHPDHVACGAKPGSVAQECAGSVILVMREMRKIAAHGDGQTLGDKEVIYYRRERKKGLTTSGILYWIVQRLGMAGVPFLGGKALPKVDEADDRISLPTFLEG